MIVGRQCNEDRRVIGRVVEVANRSSGSERALVLATRENGNFRARVAVTETAEVIIAEGIIRRQTILCSDVLAW